MSGPIRDLRSDVATALSGLGLEVVDTLPDDNVNPPMAAVGMVSIAESLRTPGLLTFGLEVSLVGHRADYQDAQMELDDLEWSVWQALSKPRTNRWSVAARPRSLTIANHEYPAVVFTVEAVTPCD
jgi:hypothetical protein